MARFNILGFQYPDDAGEPLVSGKIFFFESGTTTPKDTFADVNLSIPNSNPVILSGSGRSPNVFFNGSARAMLTDMDEVQIEVLDPIGGGTGSGQFETWNALTIYNTPDIVIGSNDRFYQTFEDNNQGNDPTTSPTFWEEIEFIRIWNASVTYAINTTVKGSDGLFYRSLSGGNIGNDPVTSSGFWGAPTASGPDLALVQASVLSF